MSCQDYTVYVGRLEVRVVVPPIQYAITVKLPSRTLLLTEATQKKKKKEQTSVLR